MADFGPDSRPADGSAVELHHPNGAAYQARVENTALAKDIGVTASSVAAGEHIVAASMLPPGTDVSAASGDRLELTWMTGSTAVTLPVTLIELRPSNQVQVWSMVASGVASAHEMRRGTRVVASEPVELELAEGGATITGTTVDISAGGMQCVMPAGPDDAVLMADTDVTCRFALAEEQFELAGAMLAVWSDESEPTVHVTVRFAASDRERLGRTVAAVQQ